MSTPLEVRLQILKLQEQQAIEMLAAEGIVPCSREGVWSIGVPGVFSVSCREIDAEQVGMRVCVYARAERAEKAIATYIWGAPWPDHDQAVNTTRLLDALTVAWPVIARPFRRGGQPYQEGPREVADLAALIDNEALPRLVFVANGPALAIEWQSARFEPGAECLIVVESLLMLGDLLADRINGSTSAIAWTNIRVLADVFPSQPDFAPENATFSIPPDAELNFYAEKYETECDSLRRWGLRHIANWYLTDRHTVLPNALDAIPSWEEVAPLVEKLGVRMGRDEKETIEAAENEFLIECRNHFYYKRWPT